MICIETNQDHNDNEKSLPPRYGAILVSQVGVSIPQVEVASASSCWGSDLSAVTRWSVTMWPDFWFFAVL
jgi:hypothetical protein